jgi:hypothetical protein
MPFGGKTGNSYLVSYMRDIDWFSGSRLAVIRRTRDGRRDLRTYGEATVFAPGGAGRDSKGDLTHQELLRDERGRAPAVLQPVTDAAASTSENAASAVGRAAGDRL